MAGPLDRYRQMRRFGETPEPSGTERGPEVAGDLPRFVVQEHHARRLHWDFRLERDGVLVSWAIPRGVPPDPSTNHLAVHTEDHPMSYIDFDGEIPVGNYGAGHVAIWDRGTYEMHKWEPREVMVTLHGERVEGRYVLFRTRGDDWMIHRMDLPQDPTRQPLPAGLAPMLATPGPLPPAEDEHAFEILWVGMRAVVVGQGGRVRVLAADGSDVSAMFPEMRPLGRALGAREVIFDGVVTSVDGGGKPDPSALDRRRPPASEAAIRRVARDSPAVYMVFDQLWSEGHPLLELAYRERREHLDGLGLDGDAWKVPASHLGDGAALLDAGRQQGLRGLVAKRLDSLYEPAVRSTAWVEVRI